MNTTWQQSALCKGHTDLFYSADAMSTYVYKFKRSRRSPSPYTQSIVDQCKRICVQCPVMDQCKSYALDNNERFGVWGGLAWYERVTLLNSPPVPH